MELNRDRNILITSSMTRYDMRVFVMWTQQATSNQPPAANKREILLPQATIEAGRQPIHEAVTRRQHTKDYWAPF